MSDHHMTPPALLAASSALTHRPLSEAHLEFPCAQRHISAARNRRRRITNDTVRHLHVSLPRQQVHTSSKMSEHGEVEVENPAAAFQVLPKDAIAEMGTVKLFNKWSYEDVEIRDISLT